MPEVISFDEALQRTHGEDRALLIGNGFSANYFSYNSLFESSDLAADSPVRSIFDKLKTVDFEKVVRVLEEAAPLAHIYGNEKLARNFEIDAQEVRQALVRAVCNSHPLYRLNAGVSYNCSSSFLDHFYMVFSLNYDLLLYWTNLENRKLADGFSPARTIGAFRGPFSTLNDCHLFNLHGGLHLFETATGEVEKALASNGDGVIATITDAILIERRLPLYVAEGTTIQKMQKINSSGYLRFCYEVLKFNSEVIFVYGHNADDNDAHIYRAIFERPRRKHLYFGIYQPNKTKVQEFDGKLAKYQRTAGTDIPYTFFNSETAKVWEA